MLVHSTVAGMEKNVNGLRGNTVLIIFINYSRSQQNNVMVSLGRDINCGNRKINPSLTDYCVIEVQTIRPLGIQVGLE